MEKKREDFDAFVDVNQKYNKEDFDMAIEKLAGASQGYPLTSDQLKAAMEKVKPISPGEYVLDTSQKDLKTPPLHLNRQQRRARGDYRPVENKKLEYALDKAKHAAAQKAYDDMYEMFKQKWKEQGLDDVGEGDSR